MSTSFLLWLKSLLWPTQGGTTVFDLGPSELSDLGIVQQLCGYRNDGEVVKF